MGRCVLTFKYEYLDYFAELKNNAELERIELMNFFDENIKNKFNDHKQIGISSKEQKIFHICYDCNIDLWNDIFIRVCSIAEKCDVNLDWEEIKYFLKFTFIWMPPGGGILPHVAHHLASMSAFNIPLRGENFISFYDETEDFKPGKKLKTYEYKNPTFLNVNKFHGVVNNSGSDRLVLKTHLTIVPWDKLKLSYMSLEKIKMFNFEVPWKRLREIPLKHIE